MWSLLSCSSSLEVVFDITIVVIEDEKPIIMIGVIIICLLLKEQNSEYRPN